MNIWINPLMREKNKPKWYKELESHILVTHSATYKTILVTGPHFYIPVTRVNFLTACLWKDHFNSILKANPSPKFEPINRIGWLVMQKKYRHEHLNKLKNHVYEIKAV